MNGNPLGDEINFNGGNYVISNLPAGTYTVILTDQNLCDTTFSFSIIQPSLLIIPGYNSNPVSCFGENDGSISIQALGGVAPYHVSWTGPVSGNPAGTEIAVSAGTYLINNLTAGSYTVTVTDNNGCDSSIIINVSQPPLLSIDSIITTNVLCYGDSTGTATIYVSGGSPSYQVLWTGPTNGNPPGNEIVASPGYFTITGLKFGIYQVSVYDNNGCDSTISIL